MICNHAILITGATAVGKTRVGLDIAQLLPNVEIVSVDSRQIYRQMDIGTAKPSFAERAECPHHFIDILNPDEVYNAAKYGEDARKLITDIWFRGGIPVLVGGTGLYWQSIFDGLFKDTVNYEAIRAQLHNRLRIEGLACLYAELGQKDPATHNIIAPNDTQRILRALEVANGGEHTLSELKKGNTQLDFDCNLQMIWLTMDRAKLYHQIDRRVDSMIKEGLPDEVQALLRQGYGRKDAALGTLGYAEIMDWLEGELSFDDAVEQIKLRTRQFSKRQITWCRRDRRLRELNLDMWGRKGVVGRIVEGWKYFCQRPSQC